MIALSPYQTSLRSLPQLREFIIVKNWPVNVSSPSTRSSRSPKVYQRLGPRLSLKSDSLTFCPPFPNFYRDKKCNIWPRFSITVAFDALSFRNYATYVQIKTCIESADDCSMYPPNLVSFRPPTPRIQHFDIGKFNPLKCLHV